MPNQPAPSFEGFSSPNTTPVPDVLFDDLMQDLDNAELRVLMYIIRRTYGFKKSTDNIAISQMVDGIVCKDGRVLDRGTGMAKSSVTRALSGLLTKGIIIARRNRSRERGNEPTTYALKFKKEEQATLVPNAGQAPLVPAAGQPLSQQRDKQETVIQETDLSNIRTAAQTNETTAQLDSEGDSRSVGLDTGEALVPVTRARGGQPKGMADLLRDYQPRYKVKTVSERDAQLEIASHISDIAPGFGDKAPVKSSTTRAYNLYKQSGLALPVFVLQLLTVRTLVNEISARRRIKNRMTYFFRLLEDNLGISPDEKLAS